MIHEFTGKGRIFWFPKAWANSVVRWICGVFSPSGTIQVTNNLSPDGEGSLALDVNMNAVAKRISEMRDERELSEAAVSRTAQIVRGLLDGTTVVTKGEHISVSEDWVARIAEQVLASGASGASDESDESDESDYTDVNTDDGTDAGTPWSWSAGTNGLKFDCYCEVQSDADSGVHYLKRCTLTFDKSGRLTSASLNSGYKTIYA